MPNEKVKSDIKTIAWITMAWIIIGLCIFLYDYLILHSPYVTLTGFDWPGYLLAQVLACFFSGLTGGTAAVLLFHRWLRSMPYGRALFLIFLLYSLFSLFIGFFAGAVFFSQKMEQGIFSSVVLEAAWGFLIGMESSRLFLVWLAVMMGTLIMLVVNDKYGPGVFLDMLRGKYFHPRKEERIFMFLDLRGSTTIAEKLGEEKYFEFIRETFADATPAILRSQGEIYQYIGDEILISWKMRNGLSEAHCVRCFFEIEKMFANRSAAYLARYGVVPDFKAGLHGGMVMAGEVGVVKRDIAFSGDVLNTAARIQGECNRLDVDILLSQNLWEKLEGAERYFSPTKMEDIQLRGKTETIGLVTVTERQNNVEHHRPRTRSK